MKLDNQELYELLVQKGVTHFHHANSLATAITFIEEGGLLSRGDVEKEDLIQTNQSSDDDDKDFDVWDDVFIDVVDLHGYFPRQNLYGPVLFKFNIDFLLDDDLDIWVTKNNPIYWNNKLKHSDKYFKSVKELRKSWEDYPTQQKMFTIRKPDRPVLFENLEEIILDNPKVIIHDDISLRKEAMRALKKATRRDKSLWDIITLRECRHCFCHNNYLNQVPVEDLERLFLPAWHEYFRY